MATGPRRLEAVLPPVAGAQGARCRQAARTTGRAGAAAAHGLQRQAEVELRAQELERLRQRQEAQRETVEQLRQTLRQVWDATNDQDRRLAEENQRGINSTAYQPGPDSQTYEFGVVNFVDWYSERMLNNLGAEPLISRRRQHLQRLNRSALWAAAGYGAQHACKEWSGTREIRLRGLCQGKRARISPRRSRAVRSGSPRGS